MFNGTEVLGNIIKLLKGKTGIILGKFIDIILTKKLILLYIIYSNDILDCIIPKKWKYMA